jgi:hypothetical protein
MAWGSRLKNMPQRAAMPWQMRNTYCARLMGCVFIIVVVVPVRCGALVILMIAQPSHFRE